MVIESDQIMILIATWKGHRNLLRTTLRPFFGFGRHPVILSYDDVQFPPELQSLLLRLSATMPNGIILATNGGWLKGRMGECHNIINGCRAAIEKGCELILKISGDVLINPEMIQSLIPELDNADFITDLWGKPEKHMGTAFIFGRVKPLLELSEGWLNFDQETRHFEKTYGLMAKEKGYAWLPRTHKWWREKIDLIEVFDSYE